MNSIAFAFAMLLVGATAVPHLQVNPQLMAAKNDARFVEGIVADVIADVSQQIRDMGLDPFYVESWNDQYKLPVTDLLTVEGNFVNVLSTGLSNIVINRISFGILTSRLQMELALPRIAVSMDTAKVEGQILGLGFDASVDGSFAVVEPRISVDVRINIGIISGISIRSLDIDFNLGGIESDLKVVILGEDYSATINQFVGNTLPTAITANRAGINELIEYIAWIVIEDML